MTPTVTDIGTRIELVPMDGHFRDITVALYRQSTAEGPAFHVHTYSGLDGAQQRVDEIRTTMRVLGGLGWAAGSDGLLSFACRHEHELAVRRVFLEACKVDPSEAPTPRPLSTLDRKSGLTIAIEPLGDGQYRVGAEAGATEDDPVRRVGVIVNGLLKLGDMRRVEQAEDCVGFDCGCAHDELVGLLLVRAPNVRAIVREQQAVAARGSLAAPSQQGS
jgi:hypothetical protein